MPQILNGYLLLPVYYFLGVWLDPYYFWEIIFILTYSLLILIEKKRLSVKSFLVIGLGLFALRIGFDFINKINLNHELRFPLFDLQFYSSDLLDAFAETAHGLVKFLLIWGIFYMVRRYYEKWKYYKNNRKFRVVIYLILFVIILYINLYYEVAHTVNKSFVYRIVYNLWEIIIPQFRILFYDGRISFKMLT